LQPVTLLPEVFRQRHMRPGFEIINGKLMT
jgi:hypothetical protein